jgi:hypothetical protein
MSKPNGTDAKDIALHFIDLTMGRATPAIIAKTVNQAKVLLASDYTKEEIISVIDYIVANKSVTMYSLGYVNACINSVLREINLEQDKQKANKLKQTIKTSFAKQITPKEVVVNDDSTQRNKNKCARFGVQPRVRTKPYLDLFEKQ